MTNKVIIKVPHSNAERRENAQTHTLIELYLPHKIKHPRNHFYHGFPEYSSLRDHHFDCVFEPEGNGIIVN